MKFFRVFSSVLLCVFIVFTITFGVNKISEKKDLTENLGYKGIITVWHVDTFEGGSGSRKAFLLKIARNFEKVNNGVLVFVISHTPLSVQENFIKGSYPDIISYGAGVEVENVISLPIENYASGGIVAEKNLAIPWCRGGYFLIKNNEFNIKNVNKNVCLVSNAEYTLPILSILDKNYNFNLKINTQYNAYSSFVNGEGEYLLGTQRDIVRLNNRGFNYSATPLSEFNDLYQYVSVTSTNSEKIEKSIDFINYLLSKESQQKLNEIDMFSCFYNVEYADEKMSQMQQINNFNTISVFNKKENLTYLKELSHLAYGGDISANNKIKNFII